MDIEYPLSGMDVNIEASPRAGYRYKVIYTIPYIREKYHMPRTLSKLYNLSLEQVIENVNPHKRARYS